ncbi:uncharacterized protein KGF55_001116 [Candida pseudojiufengensis]|uniref:uncharacterized protein n=1 Tax=Candida pseudojiufengensis TaxID=497109 RepID=UPI0022247804|nr:uncharacterized protein KGF55_001116 [Candida pseudojiufengensis]KAI5965753.1 hypothetical protein KGF55_001116 [Candida pseudojiufengensis]
MVSIFSLSSIILSVSSLAIADISCNPLKQSNCPPNPALSGSIHETFNSNLGSYFSSRNRQGDMNFGNDGISLVINKRFDNPSFLSNFYLMFGYVEVEMQAAEGKGIISSFYLQSDDLDEIDIEFFGGDPYEWQSNYFLKGDITTYDRGEYHPLQPSPLESYHKYAINWTSDKVDWSIDGQIVRSLTTAKIQSPCRIYAGIWAGGDPSNEIGTIQWAGGYTDYSQVPFTMHIKSITAMDYSTGNSYSYTDQTGNLDSINSNGGEINGRFNQAQQDIADIRSGNGFTNSGSTGDSSSSSAVSSSSSSNSSSSSSSSPSPSSSSSSSSSVSSSSSSSSSSEQPTSTSSSSVTSSFASTTSQSQSESQSSNPSSIDAPQSPSASQSQSSLVFINTSSRSSQSTSQAAPSSQVFIRTESAQSQPTSESQQQSQPQETTSSSSNLTASASQNENMGVTTKNFDFVVAVIAGLFAIF